MIRFAKVFEIAGQQLLAQVLRKPIPCKCGKFACVGFKIAPVLCVTTHIEAGALEMILAQVPGGNGENVSAQLFAGFVQEDAARCLEILQRGYYDADKYTQQEADADAIALMTRILGRATAPTQTEQ